MNTDVTKGGGNRRHLVADVVWRLAVIGLALCLPFAQAVRAVDVYYARAIGQDFLPEAPPPAAAPTTPKQPKPAPELPALGASAEPPAAASGGTSLWTKILVGVVVVGAIAALGKSGGGGSADATVGTGGAAPNPAPASTPPPTPTQTAPAGGGGINIGIGGGGHGGDKK